MFRRREGFTLIELLVVIAIIGILASMVFPVFARAREWARKVVCLSNVKNIALAFQMYLADYQAFYPSQHRDAHIDDIFSANGCGSYSDPVDGLVQPWSGVQTGMNPYLRGAVILDEYVKNRDVWNCPSAKFYPTMAVLPTYEAGLWIDVYNNHWGDWGGGWSTLGPCRLAFPPGWGGDVTDSFTQGFAGMVNNSIAQKGAFLQTIGTSGLLRDLKDSEIDDAVRFVVAGDSGFYHEIEMSDRLAYPDRLGIALACWRWQGEPNWSDPACGAGGGAQDCGVGGPEWSWDAQIRKDSNSSRHLGGVNVGFADGHARWINSETVLFSGVDWRVRYQPEATPLAEDRPITGGLDCCGLRSVEGRPDVHD